MGVVVHDADRVDEFLECDSLDGKSYISGIAGGGLGFGSCLARSQLFVDIVNWPEVKVGSVGLSST